MAAVLSELYEMVSRDFPGGLVTPAQFRSEPASPNTVPAEIVFSIDMRHPDDAALREMEAGFRTLVAEAAAEHGCEAHIEIDNDCAPVVFHDDCVKAVEAAAQHSGYSHQRMSSGAGHDACHVALKAPTGMIFIPCYDGLSHNEAESIDPAAAGRGVEVLLHSALHLAEVVAERGPFGKV